MDSKTSIDGFKDALLTIADNPGLVADKASSAIERVYELSWGAKARQISDAYESVTGSR